MKTVQMFGEPATGDFDAFWKAFPRRVKKGDARKAWDQTAKIRPPLDQILAAIEAAKRSEQWRKQSGAFVPYPATWLRAEQWDDEHEVDLFSAVQAKAWHETATGVEQRGAQLGLHPEQFANWPAFKHAVMQASSRSVVTELRRA